MKLVLENADIFIMAPCYLGYLWAAGKFCKRILGESLKKQGIIVFDFFFLRLAVL